MINNVTYIDDESGDKIREEIVRTLPRKGESICFLSLKKQITYEVVDIIHSVGGDFTAICIFLKKRKRIPIINR